MSLPSHDDQLYDNIASYFYAPLLEICSLMEDAVSRRESEGEPTEVPFTDFDRFFLRLMKVSP